MIRAGQPAHDLSFPTIPAHLAAVAKRDGLTPLRAGSWDYLVRPVGGVVLVYMAPHMGDIGEPVRHIEFEPLPTTVPAEPAVTPTPEKVPA